MRRYRNDLTAERVRELFELRDDALYRRKGGRGYAAGARAGYKNTLGYRAISVDGAMYYEHRLIYLHKHGEWPVAEVDHKHGKEMGNCPSNLRAATKQQNAANSKTAINNTSGHKGVSPCRRTGRYHASVTVNGKKIHLLSTPSKEEAATWYKAFAELAFGDFARAS